MICYTKEIQGFLSILTKKQLFFKDFKALKKQWWISSTFKHFKDLYEPCCKQFTDWLLGERQREGPALINIPADEMINYLCVFIIGICKKMATIMVQIHWLFFFLSIDRHIKYGNYGLRCPDSLHAHYVSKRTPSAKDPSTNYYQTPKALKSNPQSSDI